MVWNIQSPSGGNPLYRPGPQNYSGFIPPLPPYSPFHRRDMGELGMIGRRKDVADRDEDIDPREEMEFDDPDPLPPGCLKTDKLPSPKTTPSNKVIKFLGFDTEGFVLIQDTDEKTKKRKSLLEQRLNTYMGSYADHDLETIRVPVEAIKENLVVVVKWQGHKKNNLKRHRKVQDNPKHLDKGKGRGRISSEENNTKGVGEVPAEDCQYARAQIVQKVNEAKGRVWCRNLDTWEAKEIPILNVFWIHQTVWGIPLLMQPCKIANLEFWCHGNILVEVARKMPPVMEDAILTKISVRDGDIPVIDLELVVKHVNNRWISVFPKGTVFPKTTLLSFLVSKGIPMLSRAPKRFQRGRVIKRCHISCVEEYGSVWISLKSALSIHLTRIGETLPLINKYNLDNDNGSRNTTFEYAYVNRGCRSFLARYLYDRSWYRVEVLEYERGDHKAKVRYLDFGTTATIPIADMMPSELVDPLLPEIPPQAFKGYLNGITEIRNVDIFNELITNDCYQKLRIVGYCRRQGRQEILVDCYVAFDQELSSRRWTHVNSYVKEMDLVETLPRGIVTYKPLWETHPEFIQLAQKAKRKIKRRQALKKRTIEGTTQMPVIKLHRKWPLLF